MGLVLSILYPLFMFIDIYKWYFIIAIGLYIVLTITFRWARQAITIAFSLLALFFCLSHLPHIYSAIGGVLSDMGTASSAAVEAYVGYVSDNILKDKSLSPGEKLDKAIQYGLTGKADNQKYKLPTSKEKGFKETLNYVVDSTKWGSGVDGTGNPSPGIVDPVPENETAFEQFAANIKAFGKMIWNEFKALVT